MTFQQRREVQDWVAISSEGLVLSQLVTKTQKGNLARVGERNGGLTRRAKPFSQENQPFPRALPHYPNPS